MRVKFNQNLGADDARAIGDKFGCKIDPKQCTVGAVVDLDDEAAAALAEKYKALFEAVNSDVRGQAKKPEVTAPAK